MIKKIILASLALILFLPFQTRAVEFGVDEIQPVISGDDIVRVGKNIIFDASSTFLLDSEQEVTFEWDLGDGTTIVGEEVVHSYSGPGAYTVTLTVRRGEQQVSTSKQVFAYNKLIFLLTDVTERQESILSLKSDAAEEGTFIFLIESYESTTAFMSEEALYNKLNDNLSTLVNADSIVIWTTRGSGVNALTRLVQQSIEKGDEKGIREALKTKSIVVISEENLGTLSRIMQGNFNIIQPKEMIITRQYELKNFIVSPSDEEFVSNLEQSISDYRLINEETGRISVWNSISYLVSFMISQGIPSNTIVLLLMLPIIATIIAILKQVVGITTFGLYTPSIITLSFLALGLKFGLVILFIIIITGAAVRKLLDRFHLLHIPRIAIVLTFSTLIILLTLALGTYLGISSIATIAVFPMLIMTTLAEKFVSALGGRGFYAAILLMIETTIVSLICYWVVEWHYLQNLILGHPEIILLLILFNYVLGRWTGLRLIEYVRFREVMKHTEE